MRIGTRGSALAQWQARAVATRIKETGGPLCDIVIIRTSGDERSPSTRLGASGPPDPPTANVKRMFVKEIEDAVLDGHIDLAVHSSKDLPAALPDGLVIAAALERDDPRDVLSLALGTSAPSVGAVRALLPLAARIGTSSVRRIAQLRGVFPTAAFTPIRGNVDTRLRKLDAGEFDAIVLAAAGVKRLQLEARITTYVPVDVCVPAPGQGIIAVEIAAAAPPLVKTAVLRISDADAIAALTAERAVVQALGGSCQMPLGAFASFDAQDVTIAGCVASPDGGTVIREKARGNRGNPAAVGEKLARLLREKGADRILADLPSGE